MKAFVVDENVTIVANDVVKITAKLAPSAPQADDKCRLSCVRKLREIVKTGMIIVDDMGEVLRRYREYLDGRGQPGVGDAFLKHVTERQYDRRKVRRCELNTHPDRSFEAFPSSKELAGFDPSDRLYVALAIAAREKPKILNAVDSDYSIHAKALSASNVVVDELCPNCI